MTERRTFFYRRQEHSFIGSNVCHMSAIYFYFFIIFSRIFITIIIFEKKIKFRKLQIIWKKENQQLKILFLFSRNFFLFLKWNEDSISNFFSIEYQNTFLDRLESTYRVRTKYLQSTYSVCSSTYFGFNEAKGWYSSYNYFALVTQSKSSLDWLVMM